MVYTFSYNIRVAEHAETAESNNSSNNFTCLAAKCNLLTHDTSEAAESVKNDSRSVTGAMLARADDPTWRSKNRKNLVALDSRIVCTSQRDRRMN